MKEKGKSNFSPVVIDQYAEKMLTVKFSGPTTVV